MKPMVRFLVAAAWLAVLLTLSGGLAAQTQKPDPLMAREREDLTKPQFSKPPELPPKEFRGMMRANNEILAIDTPPENPTGGATFTGAFQGELAQHFTLHEEDYGAIVKDAQKLKANFAKIEAFFSARQSSDGVELAKAGEKALQELEAEAAAKNRLTALSAAINVATTCRNCHLSHRVYVVTDPIAFGIVG
jgi:hypothetical protein